MYLLGISDVKRKDVSFHIRFQNGQRWVKRVQMKVNGLSASEVDVQLVCDKVCVV